MFVVVLRSTLSAGHPAHRVCVSPEELRKQEETGQLLQPVFFVLLVLVSVLLYFAVSLMDPGFILSNDSDLQVNAGPPIVVSFVMWSKLLLNVVLLLLMLII